MKWRALSVFLLLPAAAWGQRGAPWPRTEESHVAIPASASGMSATELLARKLGEAELPDYLRRLLNKSGGVDAAAAQKLLQDPFAADILKRFADGDPALLKLVEQFAAGRPELKGLSSDQLRQLLTDRANGLINPSGRDTELGNSPATLPPTPAERERLARQAYNERITDMLRDWKMEGVLDHLREAPAFQNWMQELGKAGNRDGVSPLTLGDTMHMFGGFDQWMQKIRPFLPKDLSALRRLDVSRPSTPTVHLPSFSLSRPTMPSFDPGGNWSTYVVLSAAVVIVLVALLRMKQVKMQPVPVPMRLGPWPVDPSRVATRQELIAAFEYLAVLKCGAAATHWHHRDVADKLGCDPAARIDAQSLAGLYEQARYAATMTDHPAFWESARTALGRLSGGGS